MKVGADLVGTAGLEGVALSAAGLEDTSALGSVSCGVSASVAGRSCRGVGVVVRAMLPSRRGGAVPPLSGGKKIGSDQRRRRARPVIALATAAQARATAAWRVLLTGSVGHF